MWRNIIDKELPICYSIENERRELWNGTLWSPVNSDAAVNQWLLEFMNPVRLETVQERIRNMKPGESLLVYHRADLSDLLRQSENAGKERKTTFVCTRCGRPVWQSDSNSRRICTCKCLTAIFSPPYKILSW